MIREYFLNQKLDEKGRLEEFTRDCFLVLPMKSTEHLNDEGLPLVGTIVYPGMLLIAKFGTTQFYRREAMPCDLERWSLGEEELIKKYGHMFYDGSFYVPSGVYGVVREAFFEDCEKLKKAVVRVDQTEKL